MQLPSTKRCGQRGPANARILIVGEAPGENEETAGIPFVGRSGQELGRELAEAGIDEAACRFTNVLPWRPPNNDVDWFFFSSKKAAKASDDSVWFKDRWCRTCVPVAIEELEREVLSVRPNIVVALGNTALWALSDNWGITKWRGSLLWNSRLNVKVLPAYHPAGIQRNWSTRWITINDFKRVAREWHTPAYHRQPFKFLLAPDFNTVCEVLDFLETQDPLSVDIETRKGQIACVGIAWSRLDAICIPIISARLYAGYYSREQEVHLYQRLGRLLRRKRCIGHFFSYDMQYFAAQMGFIPRVGDDTMVKHAACFPGTPKNLGFVSSLYNDHHIYWKDDGKEWLKDMDETKLWSYNCLDTTQTFEANEHMEGVLDAFNQREQYMFLLDSMRSAFRMMLRGIRVDRQAKAELSLELAQRMLREQDFLRFVLRQDINIGSPPQVAKLFYDRFGLKKKYNKDGGLTTAEGAVEELLHDCEPILRPILKSVLEYRSLGVYKRTFADAAISADGRMRSSLDVVGTDTYRWSSSTDAFGFGTNQQNVPGEEQ